ncbi:MFS transporter [Cellulomonas edaphi]|uniref:MFS transporter n=1 Tax=Cellulomonas edaphi TaxID=3053468 RepID=A0ABT7S987_9CELL|nr:MFS transporter [Cellulomons edaphi]MDM7832190.1 MFS transporter [Cellulomons edaphi]
MTTHTGATMSEQRIGAASRAVYVVFFFAGFNFASWASRLPAVRDGLGFSESQMGLLLLVGALGSLFALPLAGIVVERLGARRTVAAFGLINAAGLVIASVGVGTGSVVLTAAGLVTFGIGTGVWDAAMNLEGAAVEQKLGRTIMPRYHAGFSFGTFAAAGVAAVAAGLHVPVWVHLPVAVAVASVCVLVAVRSFLPPAEEHAVHPSPGPQPASSSPRGARGALAAWREPRTLLIGLVVMAAALTEGSANDWVSLAVVDGWDAQDAVGALGFAVFVGSMTTARWFGTWVLDRWGRVAVLRACSGLALVGLVLFGLVGPLWLAVVGVILWGAGASLGFPVGMSAASDDPLRAAARVSVVSTIGYSAFLAGPPLLGLLAHHVGYRHALLAITIPVVLGLLVTSAAAPLRTSSTSGD